LYADLVHGLDFYSRTYLKQSQTSDKTYYMIGPIQIPKINSPIDKDMNSLSFACIHKGCILMSFVTTRLQ